MKKLSCFAVSILLTASALISACESSNDLGPCIGAFSADHRNPELIYDLSIWNAFWGIVGVEMIFPPLLVLHHETFCPVARKSNPAPSLASPNPASSF